MKNVVITVKKDFVDKYTGKKHKPGDKLTVTDARFREIKRSGDYAELDKAATHTLTVKKDAAEKAVIDSKK